MKVVRTSTEVRTSDLEVLDPLRVKNFNLGVKELHLTLACHVIGRGTRRPRDVEVLDPEIEVLDPNKLQKSNFRF